LIVPEGPPTYDQVEYLGRKDSTMGKTYPVCEASLDMEIFEVRLGPMIGPSSRR
jgi:hypothetical protein